MQIYFTIRNIKNMPMNYFHPFFPMKMSKKPNKKF